MKKRLVVIGNGMAGMRTVEELLSIAPEKYEISVFGAEAYGNYNRIMLSAVLSGEKVIEDIMINNRQWYEENAITLYAGPDKTVVKIDRDAKQVHAQDGLSVSYDVLLIATGSRPFILPIPGHQLAGVICFRDIIDVNTMLSYSKTHKTAVVLGGGLLGLEAANGLALQGMAVTVLHDGEFLLNRQLDPQAATLLRKALEQRGIKFKMCAKTEALLGDDNAHVSAVKFVDGDVLDCDLFVMAIGIRPNMALAQEAGLVCERGIVVNDGLQTSDPCIYSVGECIQHRGNTFGLVAPLFDQAKVCADHLGATGQAEFIHLPTATKLKVTGINVFSVGDFIGVEGTQIIHFSDAKAGVYKKLVIKDEQLVGAVLYGDTADSSWYQSLLENNQNIAGVRDSLIFGYTYATETEAA
ncbi:MAG: assimilatory nitrite reductase large subunit [Methylobacter sp.]|nr:MAG: assimilatory nitrite reductase large subunit [Methylobacter sp.]PPD17766.1 MAG: assimilatory nitrite reductase large subunit [Methylobacter sp.]